MVEVLFLQIELSRLRIAPVEGVSFVRAERDHLLGRLLSDSPPAMLVLDSTILGPATARTVEALFKRNLLPPTVVSLNSDPTLLSAAWTLAQFGVAAAFGPDELRTMVIEAAKLHDSNPGAYLKTKQAVSCATTLRLLTQLDTVAESRLLPITELASQCRTTRNALYYRVAAAGLPTPEQMQMLFRLWPAVTVLRRGGTLDEAADRAFLADSRSLRRALRLRFAHHTSDLRAYRNGRDLLDHWLRLHACAE